MHNIQNQYQLKTFKPIDKRTKSEGDSMIRKKSMIKNWLIIQIQKMRKTSNILIRESSKKSGRENPQAITNTSFKSNSKRSAHSIEMEVHKEMVRAESLNQQQQQEIHNEARRTVTKKIRNTEHKIQNDMLDMLEKECSKLGADLERERAENQKLRAETDKLRKNIENLNEKLERAFNDKTHLSKNQIDGKIENRQLAEQINNLKSALKNRQAEVDFLRSQKQTTTDSMRFQIMQLKQTIEKLNINNKNLKEEKQEIQEELEERTKQAQYLRENFQAKKKEWETQKRQFQAHAKSNIEKKGEKITKFQVDLQKVQDKLKEEETMRKKLVQKNKQLQKQAAQQIEVRKDLQQQIANLKKRVNDLSILKSSNNAIMNQKISKIVQQNQKLKAQVEEMKTGGKPEKSIEKPVLFGANDFD